MTQQERDLVDTLAGQKRPRRDGVPERVHRWQLAARHTDRRPLLVDLMKDRKRWQSTRRDRPLLRVTQGSRDVPLTQRPAATGREHERLGPTVDGGELVASKH